MHNPLEAMKTLSEQMGWLSQMMGEDFWSYLQSSMTGKPPPALASRPGPPVPGGGTAPQATAAAQQGLFPPLDLYVTASDVVLSLVLPGLTSMDHVSIALSAPNEVVIEAFVLPTTTTGVVLRRERFSGYCTRSVVLPTSVLPTGARARYEDGILEVYLARKDPGQGDGGISLLHVSQG